GLTANVNILISRTGDAVLVANGALRFTPPAKAVTPPPPRGRGANGETLGRVWVLQNGKPVARDVKTGRTDGHNTEVLSGAIKPGDQVITDIASGTSGT